MHIQKRQNSNFWYGINCLQDFDKMLCSKNSWSSQKCNIQVLVSLANQDLLPPKTLLGEQQCFGKETVLIELNNQCKCLYTINKQNQSFSHFVFVHNVPERSKQSLVNMIRVIGSCNVIYDITHGQNGAAHVQWPLSEVGGRSPPADVVVVLVFRGSPMTSSLAYRRF